MLAGFECVHETDSFCAHRDSMVDTREWFDTVLFISRTSQSVLAKSRHARLHTRVIPKPDI